MLAWVRETRLAIGCEPLYVEDTTVCPRWGQVQEHEGGRDDIRDLERSNAFVVKFLLRMVLPNVLGI
mgnify:CR=1 FL=1